MSAFDGLKVEELDAELEKRGLPVEGHKADKVAALEAFEAQQSDDDSPSDDGQTDESDLYGGYRPTDDEKEAGGRIVRKSVILEDQYGRGHLYDADSFMPFEVIKANRVGEHIFSDDPTPGDQAGFSISGPVGE